MRSNTVVKTRTATVTEVAGDAGAIWRHPECLMADLRLNPLL